MSTPFNAALINVIIYDMIHARETLPILPRRSDDRGDSPVTTRQGGTTRNQTRLDQTRTMLQVLQVSKPQRLWIAKGEAPEAVSRALCDHVGYGINTTAGQWRGFYLQIHSRQDGTVLGRLGWRPVCSIFVRGGLSCAGEGQKELRARAGKCQHR